MQFSCDASGDLKWLNDVSFYLKSFRISKSVHPEVPEPSTTVMEPAVSSP